MRSGSGAAPAGRRPAHSTATKSPTAWKWWLRPSKHTMWTSPWPPARKRSVPPLPSGLTTKCGSLRPSSVSRAKCTPSLTVSNSSANETSTRAGSRSVKSSDFARIEVGDGDVVEDGRQTLDLVGGRPPGDGVGAAARADQVVEHRALDDFRQRRAQDQVLLIGIETVDRGAGRIGRVPVGSAVDADYPLAQAVVVGIVVDRDGAVVVHRSQYRRRVAAGVEPRHAHDVAGPDQTRPVLQRIAAAAAIGDAPEAALDVDVRI